MQNFGRKPEGSQLEDLGVDVMIVLEWILLEATEGNVTQNKDKCQCQDFVKTIMNLRDP
jgi:hypothetical protein